MSDFDDAVEGVEDAVEAIDEASEEDIAEAAAIAEGQGAALATEAISGAASDVGNAAVDAVVPESVQSAARSAGRIASAAVSLLDRFETFGVTTATFTFVIDGKVIGSFQSLDGMEVELEVVEIEEGGNNHSTVKRPGRMSWSNLVLRRGIATFDTLFNWINDASGDGFAKDPDLLSAARSMSVAAGGPTTGKNKFDAQTGALTLVSPLGIPLRAWWVREALPVRWKGPEFSAEVSGEGIPMEELEIAHEGLATMELPLL